jgi:ABC-2 type transport system permease protein
MLVAVITAFAAQFTRSGSLTIVIMILASVLMSAVSVFVPQAVSFLPTTYLTWYQNFYSEVHFTLVLNEFLYILAYGIIFMFTGTYLFEQKDI